MMNREETKIIFLDIDGVLVTQESLAKGTREEREYLKRTGQVMRDVERYSRIVHPPCVEVLNQIIEETGAKIVISSAWRIHRTCAELREVMTAFRVVGAKIVGKTKSTFKMKPESIIHLPVYSTRGQEISDWLYYNEVNRNVVSYVVIDDGKIEEHAERQILTRFQADLPGVEPGLQPHHVEMAVKILNTPSR